MNVENRQRNNIMVPTKPNGVAYYGIGKENSNEKIPVSFLNLTKEEINNQNIHPYLILMDNMIDAKQIIYINKKTN